MTGSSGHLGEALVRVLRGQGREVVGLDLLASPFTTVTGPVTDRAVVIPYINAKATDFVSKRLENYQHHPEFGLLIDQVWLR